MCYSEPMSAVHTESFTNEPVSSVMLSEETALNKSVTIVWLLGPRGPNPIMSHEGYRKILSETKPRGVSSIDCNNDRFFHFLLLLKNEAKIS